VELYDPYYTQWPKKQSVGVYFLTIWHCNYSNC